MTNSLLLVLLLVFLVFALPALGSFLARNLIGLSLMGLLAALSLAILSYLLVSALVSIPFLTMQRRRLEKN